MDTSIMMRFLPRLLLTLFILGSLGCDDILSPDDRVGSLRVQGTITSESEDGQALVAVSGARVRLQVLLAEGASEGTYATASDTTDPAGHYELNVSLPETCSPTDSLNAFFTVEAEDFRSVDEGSLEGELRLPCDSGPFVRDHNLYRTVFRTPQVVPGSLTAVQLSAGETHACAVSTTGSYCWGSNQWGQLGNPGLSAPYAEHPLPVSGGEMFKRVASGRSHTCAVDGSSVPWCWGDGGGWAVDPQGIAMAPVQVPGDLHFTEVVGGRYHSCGLDAAGKVHCWGLERDLGIGGESIGVWHPATEVPLVAPATRISAKFGHTCALLDTDDLYCWGFNYAGEVGQEGVQGPIPLPVKVAGDQEWRAVAAGAVRTCGLNTSGEAYCWGRVGSWLGTGGESNDIESPHPMPGGQSFERVTVGWWHACGLTNTGEVYCWGADRHGELGLPRDSVVEDCNGSPCVRTPTPVDTDLRFVEIQAGGSFTCGITTTQELVCWGSRSYLGSGRPIVE